MTVVKGFFIFLFSLTATLFLSILKFVRKFKERHQISSNYDGIYAFTHPYGCSQMGEDHVNTKIALQDMVKHPKGGYATVYVNDVYVGTVNTYSKEEDTANVNKQPLLGVELAKGSNTVEVHVVGPSQGTGYYAKFVGFSFTVPSEMYIVFFSKAPTS